MPSIRIGTSGWTYSHWKGPFYPSDCPKNRWLEYYSRHFDTVELNATFYRQPKPITFTNWKKRTPDLFLWSVKASRYITHVKRLKDAGDSLERFYESALLLGSKLGPILIQLPPGLKYDQDLVEEFMAGLNPSLRHVMEVRNASWMNDTFFQQLESHGVAFCISDTAGRYPYKETVTADFVYVRLHGSRKLYASEYTEEELAGWAEKIGRFKADVFLYFDNDFKGYAVANARRLKQMLGL